MLIKKENMVHEQRTHWRDGKGTADVIHFTKTDNPPKWRFAGVMIFEPGTSIGNHVHSGEYELYYVLEGEGTLLDNGVPVQVGPGDAVYTGAGAAHSLENTGTTTLKVLGVVVQE